MEKLDQLRELVYAKVKKEYDDYISSLYSKSPYEIINNHVWDLHTKENILMVFYGDYIDFQADELQTILKINNVLDFLATEWMDTDDSFISELKDCITTAVTKEVQRMQENAKSEQLKESNNCKNSSL